MAKCKALTGSVVKGLTHHEHLASSTCVILYECHEMKISNGIMLGHNMLQQSSSE